MGNQYQLYHGSGRLYHTQHDPQLEQVVYDHETFFKMSHYDHMDPFFMTIVSDADHWLFVSSYGGLTCGRKNDESALFPYETDDKINKGHLTTGSHTLVWVYQDHKAFLWQPFDMQTIAHYVIERNLYKSALGNRLVFEEINHYLGLAFIYEWSHSSAYGFIKTSKLRAITEMPVKVKVLDGIRNIMPYGMGTLLQNTKSTLADGYKRCELIEDKALGIYTLSSILTDKAEPSESLMATSVWSMGLDTPQILLSEIQVPKFLAHEQVEQETDIKGRRGAYYACDSLTVAGHSEKTWYLVADLNKDVTDLVDLQARLKDPSLMDQVIKDRQKGSDRLKALVYQADGLQVGGRLNACDRHYANTLFNIMRGGIYADGYTVDLNDFTSFVARWNKKEASVLEKHFETLPRTMTYQDLLKDALESGKAQYMRLVYEYLPLTYSRRHGDPSRPWNKFNIDVTKVDGSQHLAYEGNWRDIFQNWEALSYAYPDYTESIITKFLNASTADGYNPYRITKEGIDWEVIEPDDPWSYIGYWGDHQIIYLLKLMEVSKKVHPQALITMLKQEVFAYANVPYKIKGFDDLVKDPRNSIDFDQDLHDAIHLNLDQVGSDAKLVHLNGQVYHVNLVEKLLVTLLSKLSNYVPEGGIWMNTQRPEWNDANNALVGYGLSMVTLGYLHRFVAFLQEALVTGQAWQVNLSTEVVDLYTSIKHTLKDFKSILGQPVTNSVRYQVVESLGRAGESYRNKVYTSGLSGKKASLTSDDLNDFLVIAKGHLADTIDKNLGSDGLYHAYNLIKFDQETCSVSHLYPMLEGQVAAISSKALTPEQVLCVLKAMKESDLYRPDQDSYMLYPNRDLPKFMDKNNPLKEVVLKSSLMTSELEKAHSTLVTQDKQGQVHFAGHLRNADDFKEEARRLKTYSDKEIETAASLFTDHFNHHAFTGRSGTFYKYEGLGCIYWHMVSKLVLAVQEVVFDQLEAQGPSDLTQALKAAYYELQAGIGLDKTPAQYGGFTTDPYSHTPGFAGVQQPGMTGQVKEDFISRLGELGICLKEGAISINPYLIKADEFIPAQVDWNLPGRDKPISLEANAFGITLCSIPFVISKAKVNAIRVYNTQGQIIEDTQELSLSQKTSTLIFNRSTTIDRIEVDLDMK